MPKRRPGPGDYEKFVEWKNKLRRMQEEVDSMAPWFQRSPYTSDDDEMSSDDEKSISSRISVAAEEQTRESKEAEKSEKSEKSSTPIGETAQVDPEVMDILGIDDSNSQIKEPMVDPSLVKAWYKLINKGFEASKRKELLNKYPRIPEFEPKKLNAEIAASISTKHVKKDSHMYDLQKISGSALMAVGAILTNILKEEDCDKLLVVKLLNDVAKLCIEMHHALSVSRKANIFIPNLTPQVADLIKKSEIDETLFGKNSPDLIKESKALAKLSQDIKQKSDPSVASKVPFFWKDLQQRRPLSQQQGYNQAKKGKPLFRSNQQFFNRNKKVSKENAQRK